MKQLYLFIAALLISLNIGAQWTQLTDPLLSTIEYDGIVYTGQSIIIASQGGLYRSDDNGVTWQLSVDGLPQFDLSARRITYIQSRNEVWMWNHSNGVFKSTNHGQSWSPVPMMGSGGLPEFGWTEGLGRIGNRLIILVKEWDDVANMSIADLYYSDDGTSWTKGATLGGDNSIWWDFQRTDNSSFLIIVEEDYSVDPAEYNILITENGETITELPVTGLPAEFRPRTRQITSDPAGEVLMMCSEDDGTVFFYDFVTDSWLNRTNELVDATTEGHMIFNLQTLGEHTFASGLWINNMATMDVELRLYYSSDTAKAWTRLNPTGLQDMPMLSNSFIMTGTGRIVTEHFHSSLAWSDDLGANWSKPNVPAGNFPSLVALDNGKLFTVTDSPLTGLLMSVDNGDTWSEVTTDLPKFMGLIFLDYIVADGNTLYGFAMENPFEEDMRLFKSTNEGVNWTKIENIPAETEDIYFLGKHGDGLIFMFQYEDNDDNEVTLIWRTHDGGDTWTDMTTGIFGTPGVERFAGLQSNGGLIILFGRDEFWKTDVYISYNNGGSYSKITGDLYEPPNQYELLIANQWDWRNVPSAVAGWSEDGNDFYLAVYDSSGDMPWGVRFLKLNSTRDGWEEVPLPKINIPHGMKYHSLMHKDDVWYFFFPVGVGVTTDDFKSRYLLWDNDGYQPGMDHSSVVVNDYGVFTGTSGTGIWRAQITDPQFNTTSAYEVTDTSAMSGVNITSTGGLPFLAKGLCWATSSGPTLGNDFRYKLPANWETFTDTIKLLNGSTPYYARGFITTPRGTFYGNEIGFTTDQTVSIITQDEKLVKIYPNPASSFFNIETEREWKITIMNVIGKVIYESQIKEGVTTISIAGQPPGIYLVRLTGGSGETQMTRLIVR